MLVPAPPVVLAPEKPKPVVVPEVPKAPEVALSVITTPPRANVIRLDTGALIGITPLSLRLPKGETSLRLRVELAGHQPLEREASLQSDQALELVLQPVPKQKPRVVKDGVLDPF